MACEVGRLMGCAGGTGRSRCNTARAVAVAGFKSAGQPQSAKVPDRAVDTLVGSTFIDPRGRSLMRTVRGCVHGASR